MKQWKSVDELLDFAVGREEESAQFYREWAGKITAPAMREVFEQFAKEEEGHKAKLLAVKKSGKPVSSEAKITDLKIADYLVEVEPTGTLDYQKALILAMKREKAAFRLYNDLATATDDSNVRQLMLNLAQEEAKHKLRFEIEYDDHYLEMGY